MRRKLKELFHCGELCRGVVSDESVTVYNVDVFSGKEVQESEHKQLVQNTRVEKPEDVFFCNFARLPFLLFIFFN